MNTKYYFNKDLPFFKGNLHCHTTVSDGKKTPEETIALYQSNGYDFLAITDHHKLMREKKLPNFLVITGVEYHYIYPEGPRMTGHIVGMGMDDTFSYDKNLLPQQMVDAIHAHGGLAIIAHPNWSFMTIEAMMGLKADAVEVYNTNTETTSYHGDCSALLDTALQQGLDLPMVASDDAHGYERDHCESAIYVNCPTLSYKDIKEAILKRCFYAVSSPKAPRIENIFYDGEKLHCIAANCDHMGFVSDLFGVYDRVVYAKGNADRFEGTYTLHPQDKFIRIECRNLYGQAYTSYFAVKLAVVWPN